MALDTAWPWANDTYGLCCLRAYFCAHKLICARSYVVIPCCARGGERVPALGAVAVCWVRGVDCELAARVVQTGCGCWVLVLGAVSRLRAWWKQGAGRWLCACGAVSWRAGAGCARGGQRVPPGCWCSLCAWCRLGAGAGCWRWLCAYSGDMPRCIACKNWSCCQSQKNLLRAFAIWGLCWSNPQIEKLWGLTSNSNELPVRAFKAGCWCWVPALVPGAGAGAVSWLRARWRQLAGAGAGWAPGAGSGAVRWLRARWRQVVGCWRCARRCWCWQRWCWCCELAVRVHGGDRLLVLVPGAGAGAGACGGDRLLVVAPVPVLVL